MGIEGHKLVQLFTLSGGFHYDPGRAIIKNEQKHKIDSKKINNTTDDCSFCVRNESLDAVL